MTRLYLCRHGETDWNRERRFQGNLDPPLNAEGRRQAGLLAKAFAGVRLAAVHSSPLARAKETADGIASAAGAGVETDPAWAEISHGTWNGRLYAEIERDDPARLAAWRATPDRVAFENGESLADVSRRSLAALSRVFDRHAEQAATIVSHDAVLRAVLLHALGLPLSAFWTLKLGNTSISAIERDDRGALRVALLNDLCHLGSVAAETAAGAL